LNAAQAATGCLLSAALLGCSQSHAPAAKLELAASVTPHVSAAPAPSAKLSATATANALCAGHTDQAPHHTELKRAATAASALSPRRGLWLADEHYALLSAAPDASWGEGNPVYVGHGAAAKSVAMNRLPRALRAWLGRPVRVLGANGAVCDTRLQRFSLRAEITPDPATAEIWDGCAEPPLAPAAIAEDIWRSSLVSGRTLVAEFSAPCRGALLAVDPDLPAPVIAAPEPASAELGERALAAFRQLPGYAEIQTRYKAEQPDAEGAWEDHDARRGVWSLRLAAHASLVFVSVEAGTRCAKFSGSLSALWAESRDSSSTALHLLVVPKALDERRMTPSAVVDLDASGNPAVLLGPDGQFAARALLSRPSAAGYNLALLSSVPFFVGPC
jgi:hypothetical protein